jgi:DNA topoisomerase VI subunit A/intein/homing endonuclease
MSKQPKAPAPASNKAVDALYAIAEEIYEELDGGQIPKMKIPLRTKANIRFDTKHSVWKYGNLMGVRSAKKLKGALMLLRTMHVLEFIRDMIRDSKSSTLREMYYISEGWDIAKFHAQEESNLLAEDLEVITQLLREDFKLRPEESGASVIGNVTLEEITRNGDRKRINCRDDVGDAGYTIPYNVEKEKVKLIDADAKFVLAIETGGMFDRLVENGFDDDAKCVLVHLKGQPSRSTRRLLKRLNEELKLPVATFSIDANERILFWQNGLLKPTSVGPFVDGLMEKHGTIRYPDPIEHEKTSVSHLDLRVPAIRADGSFEALAQVSSVIRHRAPKEMFEIQAAYGFSTRVTGAHSVMVLGDFQFAPSNVRDLKPGDLIVAAMGLPRGDHLSEINVLELLRETSAWPLIRTDIRIGSRRLPVTEALAKGYTDFRIYGFHSDVPLPRRLAVSRPLAKLLGYFAAEGSAGKQGITLSFGAHEPDVVEDALRSIRDVFPGIHVTRSEPHAYEVQLRFGGALFQELFEALGSGRGAHSKAVPWPVFGMDREDQVAFLRSYIRGDGHARRRPTGSEITMTTVSRNLASDLLVLCAQLGLNAAVHRRTSTPSEVAPERENKFSANTVYDVCLRGELTQLQEFRDLLEENSDERTNSQQRINAKYLAIPREIITDDLRRIIRRFNQGKGVGRFGDFFWGCKRITYPVLARFLKNVPEGKSERLDFLRRLVENRIAVLPIRRVVKVQPTGEYVYDLEVPGTQTFLGGMGPVCLHNTDGDPWSFRIHASVAYGAIKTAHISEYLATPTAEFVGITASDILNYELPTDGLTPRDVGALNAEMTDPRFNDEFWRTEIQTMLQINKKAEQQALAKYGLDYVTDTYLPEKLGAIGMM